jgi:hypothetical protein
VALQDALEASEERRNMLETTLLGVLGNGAARDPGTVAGWSAKLAAMPRICADCLGARSTRSRTYTPNCAPPSKRCSGVSRLCFDRLRILSRGGVERSNDRSFKQTTGRQLYPRCAEEVPELILGAVRRP